MKSHEGLLPCPYDCAPVNPPFVMTDDIPRHYVLCDSCGARGPRCQTKRQAIAAWNARTPSPSGAREEALAVLREWLNDTPRYMGDAAKALHYQRNVRALETAIAALATISEGM